MGTHGPAECVGPVFSMEPGVLRLPVSKSPAQASAAHPPQRASASLCGEEEERGRGRLLLIKTLRGSFQVHSAV